MMARGHSTSTLCAAAMIMTAGSAANLVIEVDPSIILLGAVYLMAGSLRPDIDSKESTATHVWSLLSLAESIMWRQIARGYYERTRTADDPVDPDPHRHLTHTPFPGAVLLGLWEALWLSGAPGWGAAALVATTWAPAATQGPAWAAVGSSLALGAAMGLAIAPWSWKGRWLGVLAGAGFAYAVPATHSAVGLCVVVAATWFGCVCHALGDCVTEGGAPLRHPFVVGFDDVRTSGSGSTRYVTLSQKAGRWVMLGPPRALRFPTGGIRERLFLGLCVVVTGYVMARVFLDLPALGPL